MTRNMVIDLKRRKTAKTVTLPDNPDRWAPFADPRNPADGVVAEASMIEAAERAHAQANEWCFIANSMNFPVRHQATVSALA